MALQITHSDTVFDNAALRLDAAQSATTAVVAGTAYLFVSATLDDGVSVFSVAADGSLANVHNVGDNATLRLNGAAGVTTAVIGGTTYLFVAGQADDGVSVFSVAPNGALTNVHNVSDDAVLELTNPYAVATAVVAGTTYLFVAGVVGLNVFSVAANGTLTNAGSLRDNAALHLFRTADMTTALIDGITYLFVTGSDDDGVSVFSVAANGALTNVANVDDDATLELDGAWGVATAHIAGSTYLFVSAGADDGVSVFRVARNGTLANVANVADDATLLLNAAEGVTTALIGGTTYLFVAAATDDGISVFSVAASGALTNVANVADNGALALQVARDVTSAVVNGTTYLFAAAQLDDGVSAFAAADVAELSPGDTQLGDVLWWHDAGLLMAGARAVAFVPIPRDSREIAGCDDFDADGDADILWRHRDGDVEIWDIEGGVSRDLRDLGRVGTTWQIAGTGDFDADGDADILWRHRDGQVVTWEMEDHEYVVNHNLASVASTWEVAGTGDFDDDGDADILWRHRDGQVVTWEMENGQYVVNHNIAFGATSWRIQGTGDFDADGDADILWRHRDGDVVTWEMAGGAYVTNHNLPILATSWQIAGSHDFDSDGDADILWRHDQGDVMTWEMENGAFVTNHNHGAVAPAWRIERTGEFDQM